MLIRLASCVCFLVACGATIGDEPAKSIKAEFSRTSATETLAWVAHHHRPFLEVDNGTNDLARKNAKSQFFAELVKAANKPIDWSLTVSGVGSDSISFNTAATYSAAVPRKVKSVQYTLNVEPIPIKPLSITEQRLASRLKPGSRLRVQAVLMDLLPAAGTSGYDYRVRVKAPHISERPKDAP